MAEVIAALGVVASVAQLADYGFKLSMKLYTFSEAVYKADVSIKSISSDVSLTSTVLRELCGIIKNDESHLVSDNALIATAQTVKDCLGIFEELDQALDKSMGDGGIRKRDKIKWPFKEKKLELLRGNLDRLKASLTLMLQVLSYARDVSAQKEKDTSLLYQQHIIEQLSASERALRRRYEILKQENADQKMEKYQPLEGLIINTSVNATGSRDIIFDSTANPSEEKIPGRVEPPFETSGVQRLEQNQSHLIGKQESDLLLQPRKFLAELILCCQLLLELLEEQSKLQEEPKESSYTSSNHKQLHFFLERIRTEQLQSHHDATEDEKTEAAKNVQLRILDMLRHQQAERTSRGSHVKDGNSPLPAYEPNSPAYSPTSSMSGKALRFSVPASSHTEFRRHHEPVQGVDNGIPSTMQRTQELQHLQQQIDDTVGFMTENINNLSHHGDFLADPLESMDNLTLSAQRFRRGANQSKARGLWGIAVAAALDLGGSVYETGSSLFASQPSKKDDDDITFTLETEAAIEDFLRSGNPSDRAGDRASDHAQPGSSIGRSKIDSNEGAEHLPVHIDNKGELSTRKSIELTSDEEDELDNEEIPNKLRKKRFRGQDRRNLFLDIEAEVEDEDDDDHSGVLDSLLSQWTNLPRGEDIAPMKMEETKS